MAKKRRSAPLRYQIRKEIIDLLTRDNYLPGDQIPTEQELMEYLDVSRSTLREGLHLLEEERVIRTKHGTGRFLVATPRDYKFDITRLQSATEMLADYGIQVTTQILEVKEMSADAKIAANLELEVGGPVLFIERIRYAETVPIIYSIDILNRIAVVGPWNPIDFEGSLVVLLEQSYGVQLDYSRVTIHAVLTDDFISPRKISGPCVPWIFLEQVNYDQDGHAIIYSKDYHRADYVAFHTNRYRH